MEHEIFKKLEGIEKAILSQKDVLTFEEVCSYTGLSRSDLYKLTCTNKIPHSKPFGKMLYFDRREINNWLLQNPTTIDETELQEILGLSEKHIVKPTTETKNERRYVYGLAGIRRLFNVSHVTAQKYKDTIIADACFQQGRKIVVDVDKAMELFKNQSKKGGTI